MGVGVGWWDRVGSFWIYRADYDVLIRMEWSWGEIWVGVEWIGLDWVLV